MKHFHKGDQISAYDLMRLSAYAEYACVPETCAIAFKPSTLIYEEVAAIPFGGITALYFLQQGKIRSGQHVLIYGASVSVGTFAVQLAKYFGAAVARPALLFQMRWVSIRSGKTLIGGTAPLKTEDLMYLTELVEAGRLKPVLD